MQTHYVISEGQPELDVKPSLSLPSGVEVGLSQPAAHSDSLESQVAGVQQQQTTQYILATTTNGDGNGESASWKARNCLCGEIQLEQLTKPSYLEHLGVSLEHLLKQLAVLHLLPMLYKVLTVTLKRDPWPVRGTAAFFLRDGKRKQKLSFVWTFFCLIPEEPYFSTCGWMYCIWYRFQQRRKRFSKQGGVAGRICPVNFFDIYNLRKGSWGMPL